MHKICFTISFYFLLLHVSSTCAHHQDFKIALHSLWYHHPYRCDDTRGCVMQFWNPDDEHMCSKHVEARNKNLLWNKFCASSCLNTEINIQSVNMDKILLLYTFEVQHDHNSTIEVIPKYFQLQLRCMSQNLCHKWRLRMRRLDLDSSFSRQGKMADSLEFRN